MKFFIDPLTDKPSLTLTFLVVSFSIACLVNIASSVLLMIKGDYYTATVAPGLATLAGYVFYRLRQLDKIKIDFKGRSIELTDEEPTDNA